jgi:hypothetical protein
MAENKEELFPFVKVIFHQTIGLSAVELASFFSKPITSNTGMEADVLWRET